MGKVACVTAGHSPVSFHLRACSVQVPCGYPHGAGRVLRVLEKVDSAPATAKKTWRRPGLGKWNSDDRLISYYTSSLCFVY